MRDKAPKILDIQDRIDGKIRTLLTDSQTEKFNRMIADKKEHQEMRPDSMPMGGPPPADSPPPQ
jgi:hypothetical protein